MLNYGPDGNKYVNTTAFPTKQQFTTYHIYKGGTVITSLGYGYSKESATIADAILFLDSIDIKGFSNTSSIAKIITVLKDHKYIVETIIHDDFRKALSEANEIRTMLTKQWRHDIKVEYNLEKSPSFADVIISQAHQQSYSGILQEVEEELCDILDFLQKVNLAIHADALIV